MISEEASPVVSWSHILESSVSMRGLKVKRPWFFGGLCAGWETHKASLCFLLSLAGHDSHPTTVQTSSPQGKSKHTGAPLAIRSESLVRLGGL